MSRSIKKLSSWFKKKNGIFTKNEVIEELTERDKRLCLEMESSNVLYFLVDELIHLFPSSKFILTLRDPLSWLDSHINHILTRQAPAWARRLTNIGMGELPPKETYPREESVLAENGFYQLEKYFSYWNTHNSDVINKVPPNRLLVLRIDEINEGDDKIAKFFEIKASSLNMKHSHAFKGERGPEILSKIPAQYIKEKIEKYCPLLKTSIFK